MRHRHVWPGWLSLLVIGGLFGVATVSAQEYVDPDRQAKWEEKQAKRAEKAENRRAFFTKWEDRLGKLKPGRQPHLDDQGVSTETVSNIDIEDEVK